jgi:hypothetical protein
MEVEHVLPVVVYMFSLRSHMVHVSLQSHMHGCCPTFGRGCWSLPQLLVCAYLLRDSARNRGGSKISCGDTGNTQRVCISADVCISPESHPC